MTKTEMLAILPQKQKEGFLIHPQILEIFEDNEELPDGIETMIYHKVEPISITVYMGIKHREKLDAMLNEYIKQFNNP